MTAFAASVRSSLVAPRRLFHARPWLTRLLVWLVGCTVVTTMLGFGWWSTQSPADRTPSSARLVIAAGTAEAIRTGTGAYLPSTVSLRPGGRLTVVNDDTADHVINGNVIPAGATAEINAAEDGSSFTCTIHPSGTFGLASGERPALWLALLSGALPGLFMGGLGAGISELTRRIELG